MIQVDICTEVSPIVGTEKQSEELVNHILSEFVPEDARGKLQETLQKIINDGNGGLICIIL